MECVCGEVGKGEGRPVGVVMAEQVVHVAGANLEARWSICAWEREAVADSTPLQLGGVAVDTEFAENLMTQEWEGHSGGE